MDSIASLVSDTPNKPSAAATPVEPPPAAIEKVVIEPRGRAYLFRGIAGLIYSRGMDRLADRINRAGIKATVDTYLIWRVIADEAVREYRRDPEPITIIGHSAGGDSAMAFAEVLNAADIPVSLLVTYDPTRIADSVPPNVERYINIFQSRSIMGGGDIVQGRGFHGNYASYNLSQHSEIVHINIEKAERLHEQLVTKIAELSATPANGEGEGDGSHPIQRSRQRTNRTLGQRRGGLGARRRYAADNRCELSSASLVARPDQSDVDPHAAHGGSARHYSAPPGADAFGNDQRGLKLRADAVT